MRRVLVTLVFLLALLLVLTNLAEVQDIVATLQRGDWRWLLMAVGVQLAWVVNVAACFRALYRLMAIEETVEHLVPVAAAANFVNVVAPSMGVGGLAVFVTDGRRRGRPAARVTTALALYTLFDYLAFLVVLTLGLAVLFRRNQLGPGELVASAIFLVAAAAIATIVYLGLQAPAQLGVTLARMARAVNALLRPFLRRDYLQVARAYTFAEEIGEGLQLVRRSPEGLWLPFALALSKQALLISILFLCFLAFRQPFSVGTLIAGFSIGFLFTIVSPTPSGIGFVEGALTLGLNSLRVPLGAAAVIALAYRGITFWLPLAYGALAFRWVSREAETVPPA